MDKIVFGKVNEGADDKERVIKLVHDLEYLLSQIIKEEECDFIFYKEILPSMKEAWDAVSERFYELKKNVEEADIAMLEDHGLTGSELQFKITVINHAGQNFFHNLSESAFPLANRWLKRLLEALDKFLTSLLDAVGGSGAIGEYKSFMESSIKDGVCMA